MRIKYMDTPICHIIIAMDKLTNGWIFYNRYYVSKLGDGEEIEREYEFLGGKIHFTQKFS